MRIIVEGTNNQVTCTDGCGSVLEFTPADVSLRYQPIKVGPYEVECMPEPEDHYQAQVSCLKCGKRLNVKVSRELKRRKLDEQRRPEY